MSAPNSNYDPVQVASLAPEAIEAAVEAALAAFASAATLDELKTARLAHAESSSPLGLANREIGALPPAAKADAGKRVGQARGTVKQALTARQAQLEAERDERVLVEEAVDVTLPTDRRPAGHRHPLSTLMTRIGEVFVAMGWEVADGPELEAEWFNFDALNFGPDHPARQMQDTFFVDPPGCGLVLRTHTSPVQARALLSRELPVYVVCPGRTFRTDELEAIIGPGITTRLRPSFFPFTEPSAEMDLRCFVCRGGDQTCRTCGGLGWIEWGGCGMVNPNVLRACGVDPDVYSGFAFGMGIERTLMFRNGVADMREMVEGDLRFNAQFGAQYGVEG
jgi:phenylalanyl-tRNA synthetase alpha chain